MAAFSGPSTGRPLGRSGPNQGPNHPGHAPLGLLGRFGALINGLPPPDLDHSLELKYAEHDPLENKIADSGESIYTSIFETPKQPSSSLVRPTNVATAMGAAPLGETACSTDTNG